MDGKQEAFVTLSPGTSVGDLIGRDLFGGLLAGETPDEAAKRLGPPSSVGSDGDSTLVFYSLGTRQVAIASRMVAPSGGGQRRRSYELRAFPPRGFAAGLPVSIRELIRDERGLRRIVLVSDVPSDWHIRLMTRNGDVAYVAATDGGL